MVVSPFGLLEMEVEGVSRQALELGQPDRPQKPSMPLIWTVPLVNSCVVDADVAIAEVDQAVVAAPAIGVDDGARVDPAADDALEGGL